MCGRAYPTGALFCAVDATPLRAEPAETPALGTLLQDRYRVLRRLGQGGMGAVLLARDDVLRRDVAIKVVRHASESASALGRRLAIEGISAAQVNSPHVIRIIDLLREGMSSFLIMEYVPGPTLEQFLRDVGPLTLRSVCAIARQIATGLEAIHRSDIIHRDLKPSNIAISRDPAGNQRVVILDFGIARSFSDASHSITDTGMTVGTPAFMSPEQLRGQALDARADVFALAAVIGGLLAGRFARPAVGTVVTVPDIVRSADWPAPLREALAQGLAPSRDARPETPGQLVDLFDRHHATLGPWQQARLEISDAGDEPSPVVTSAVTAAVTETLLPRRGADT